MGFKKLNPPRPFFFLLLPDRRKRTLTQPRPPLTAQPRFAGGDEGKSTGTANSNKIHFLASAGNTFFSLSAIPVLSQQA